MTPLKDLSGKSVYDLEQEDFEKLFCRQCRYYQRPEYCSDPMREMDFCKRLVDCGMWDKLYRRQRDN